MNTELEIAAMDAKQETLLHAAICLLMMLLAIGGLVYGVAAGLVLAPDAPFTLDGILLVLVCLTVLATFAGMLALIAYREGWVKVPGRKRASPPGEGAAGKKEPSA